MNLSINNNAENKTITTLLVDDDLAVLYAISSLLQELGYKVIAVLTPREALAIASDIHQQIDLILTDIDMPEMNGYELVEQIIAIRPGIRFLFVSGGYSHSLQNNKRWDEQTNFILKPYICKLLQEKLEMLFAGMINESDGERRTI